MTFVESSETGIPPVSHFERRAGLQPGATPDVEAEPGSTGVPSDAVFLSVRDYDLAATLTSGQVFRWTQRDGGWEGVVQGRWVRLTQTGEGIRAETAVLVKDWGWLEEFLQTRVDLGAVLAAFPDDEPMRAAVAACRGLRLLRQEPWECLASFICSSTKQIAQIRQIVRLLCERFGEPVPAMPRRQRKEEDPLKIRDPKSETRHGFPPPHVGGCGDEETSALAFAFPAPERLAAAGESELRACKAGFRAPYLLAAARAVAEGRLPLQSLANRSCDEARQALMQLDGVGRKIADCVLLFACGFQKAFPVDVWVERALRRLYFPRRRVTPRRLREFSETHFGPFSGFAQQYLFHHARTGRAEFKVRGPRSKVSAPAPVASPRQTPSLGP